ncbi:Proprotein convertase subtilisin/kexin type 7 [Borealophlyctis nickersoniae]|nr:Proprotein convertase subtilisin/kexin type 7 [Borealophlyctis nickersoniae]
MPPAAYAAERGYGFLGQIGELRGYYLLEADVEPNDSAGDGDGTTTNGLRKRTEEVVDEELLECAHVRWFRMQVCKQRFKRDWDFSPYTHKVAAVELTLMLYLQYNDGINGMFVGHDMNVLPVWSRGINGSGIMVSVIDDGVQYTHPDLAPNWSEENSYNFNDRTHNVMPQSEAENHGTRCAGTIAAAVNNACGVGVAFGARLAGERLVANVTSDASEAQALNHKIQNIDIYSSSWGPGDDGMSVDGPDTLTKAAMAEGVLSGRNGRGSIYVFAAGNGGYDGDNCNFDGYANSIYTIAIGAITSAGIMPSYGEQCSAHLAVAYSGGNGLGICTNAHSGTSAAAPMAAGIIALMLSVRPELGWRDIQHLIVNTAKKNDPNDEGWSVNAAGHHISHKYGFGLLDATLLVDAGQRHALLPSPPITLTKNSYTNVKIPTSVDENDAVFAEIEVLEDDAQGLTSIEHVQVTVRLKHSQRRFLTLTLVSPQGTQSMLATPRVKDMGKAGFNPWTFMTVRCWGEKPAGTWKLLMHDQRVGTTDPYTKEPLETGELLMWTLTVHGTCGEEDVVVDPNVEVAGGRTCSHTIAVKQRQRNVATLGLVFLGAVTILGGLGYFAWRRIRYGAVLSQARRERPGLSDGDLESPLLTDLPPPKSSGSPQKPYPSGPSLGNSKAPSSLSVFKQQILKSWSTDSLSGKGKGGEAYELVGSGQREDRDGNTSSDDDVYNDSDEEAAGKRGRDVTPVTKSGGRIAALQSLSRSRSAASINQDPVKGSTASPVVGRRAQSPAPSRGGGGAVALKGGSGTNSPAPQRTVQPLTRSGSASSLLKRSGSVEMLRKLND